MWKWEIEYESFWSSTCFQHGWIRQYLQHNSLFPHKFVAKVSFYFIWFLSSLQHWICLVASGRPDLYNQYMSLGGMCGTWQKNVFLVSHWGYVSRTISLTVLTLGNDIDIFFVFQNALSYITMSKKIVLLLNLCSVNQKKNIIIFICWFKFF